MLKVQRKKLIIENQTVFFKSSEDMSELDNESIDLIITSPPYNRGKTYSSDFGEFHNDNMEESEYFSLLMKVWKECYRVAKKQAILFLNIGDSALDQGKSEKVALSAEKASWIRLQDIIWIKTFLGKGHYTPTGGSRRLNNIWEHVYLFVKNMREYKMDPKAIGIPYADKSNIGRYSDSDLRDAGNVWLIGYEKTTGATIKKGHEAPFPIGLPYRCIKLVPDVKTVLDPFGGTCSTLAACLKLGVKGYAYEKYPRIKVIESRILEGKEYQEKEESLIPHLELSIKLLGELTSNKYTEFPKIRTKIEYNNYKILNVIFKNLGFRSPLKLSLEKRLKSLEISLSEKEQHTKRYKQKKLMN